MIGCSGVNGQNKDSKLVMLNPVLHAQGSPRSWQCSQASHITIHVSHRNLRNARKTVGESVNKAEHINMRLHASNLTAVGRFGSFVATVVFLLHLPHPTEARQKHPIDRAKEGPFKCGVLGPTTLDTIPVSSALPNK